MSLWQFIALLIIAGVVIIIACQPESDRGGLTEEEYEEYEFLGGCMDWRVLSPEEEIRYWELHERRGR